MFFWLVDLKPWLMNNHLTVYYCIHELATQIALNFKNSISLRKTKIKSIKFSAQSTSEAVAAGKYFVVRELRLPIFFVLS